MTNGFFIVRISFLNNNEDSLYVGHWPDYNAAEEWAKRTLWVRRGTGEYTIIPVLPPRPDMVNS